MRKRLRKYFIVCALLTALTMCVVVIGGMYLFTTNQLKTNLMAQTELLAALLRQSDDPITLLEGSVYDHRVTYIAADGQVLYDSDHHSDGMENHLQRPEVQAAMQQGTGYSQRDSYTAGVTSLYYALRLEDGRVLRLSAEQQNILATVKAMAVWVVAGALFCVALAAMLVPALTRRLVEPINLIDLEHPLESDAYEELAPVLRRMEEQNGRIAQQLDSMDQQRQQQDVILGGMREGLVVLDDHRRVLTMNAAAREILDVREDSTGQTMLAVNRSETMVQLLQAGSGEREMELHGRLVRASVSQVEQGGMVILFQDVTADRLAEESRKQFSANVSHELRTPLTTISGYAELLASGLVRAEDAGDVGNKILKESRRLLSLIEDIMHLSRLDEGVGREFAPVELLGLAEQCVAKLRTAAMQADVTIHAQGEATCVAGDASLLEEMLTNLIENGVKYNVPGGSVTITVGQRQGRACVAVRDTGVGIAPEHQARVFERFYRVDKSRSKQTGGTGLGLSIVKHGAQLHHADINLESREGVGTCITLTFPEDGCV